MNRWLGRYHNQSGKSGDETNHLFLPGFEPWIVQPVTYSLNSNHTISAPFNSQFVSNFPLMSLGLLFSCLARFTERLKYTFFHEAAYLPLNLMYEIKFIHNNKEKA
jgi:hypothetical protein